jgi:hypothetical protein
MAHSVQVGNSEISEKSDAMRSALCALRFQSEIPNPKSKIERPRNSQPETRNAKRATRTPQHATLFITLLLLWLDVTLDIPAGSDR